MSALHRARALELDKERQTLESELTSLLDELGGNASGPLVDAEGYPRGDIDLHATLLLRQRALCLKNDISGKVREMEEALERIHSSSGSGSGSGDGGMEGLEEGGAAAVVSPPPVIFCVVGPVTPTSPADTGGLKEGDRVFAWGRLRPVSAPSAPLPSLKELGEVARECAGEGKVLDLRVVRAGVKTFVNMRPGPWSGQGCLGCVILPPPATA